MRRMVAGAVRHWRLTLLIWAVLVAVSVVAAPDFTQVATYDDNAFLPSGSSALRGAELVEQGWPEDNFTSSAVLVLLREDAPLDAADRAYAGELVAWLRSAAAPDGLGRITTHLDQPDLADALTSRDGQVMLVVAGMEVPPFSPLGHEVVEGVRGHVAASDPPGGLEVMLSGAGGIAYDEHQAIEASVARTEVLTVFLVLILVLIVLRSPVAALVPLITVGAAYAVALAVVGTLARLGMDVSYLFQMFAVVIVFGAGTDYGLLILARFSEELRGTDPREESRGTDPREELRGTDPREESRGTDPREETARRSRKLIATMAVLAGVLASTAASTMVGFSAQVVAQFGLFRTMGPALAIAVFVTLVAGVTLTPAIMRLFGRWLYWPGDVRGGRESGLSGPAASPAAPVGTGERP